MTLDEIERELTVWIIDPLASQRVKALIEALKISLDEFQVMEMYSMDSSSRRSAFNAITKIGKALE